MGSSSPQPVCLLYLFSALTMLSGCGPGASPGPPVFETHDSAGVEIVRSGPGHGTQTLGWRIAPDPELQIGGTDGDSAYVFEVIGGASRLRDGRIVVTDRRSMDVRVFGTDGTHLHSWGGQGPGPTGFGAAPVFAVREPDTLVVWDGGHARLSLYDPAGNLLAQRSYSAALADFSLAPGGQGWQVDADGSVLWAGPNPPRPRTSISTVYRGVALIDGPTGETQDLGVVPLGRELMLDVGVLFEDWFAPKGEVALGPRPFRVAVSSPEEWEIRFLDSSGGLRRILRAPIARLPVTSEVRAERREYLVDWALVFRLPPERGEWVDDHLPVPDSLPAIASLQWDRSGDLWVGRRAPDPDGAEIFDGFDTDGRWVGTVRFPKDLGRILEIGEDHVLADWRDDLGTPYLRMYHLTRPTPGDSLK